MDDFAKMTHSAREALLHVLSLKSGEKVLVVTDERRKRVGEAFHQAAQQVGAEAEIYFLPENKRPLSKIPKEMPALLEGKNVVINAFIGMSEETPFRVQWIRTITAPKTRRLGHAPGITEEMMTAGPMNVDYPSMLANVKKAMKSFENARYVHIAAARGTDIVLNIENRYFNTDVFITTEHWGNLPAGEIWCAPVETEGNGIVVCDGSIGDIGQVKHPLHIKVQAGRLVGLKSRDGELVQKIRKLTKVDKMARVIGEFGIGMNPKARLTGNLLEDEKAFKTAHIAFGNNEDMIGGQNTSKTHRDFLFNFPNITVTYKDGSEKTLMKEGEWRL